MTEKRFQKRKLPDVTSEEATEYLLNHWRHCLRCNLAEFRTTTDTEKGTYFGVVPLASSGRDLVGEGGGPIPSESKWHILLEAPDPAQQQSGIFNPQTPSGDILSPNYAILSMTFDALADRLPGSLEDCTYSFALGCRAVDFQNTHRLVKPSSTNAKMCRPRWGLELGMAKPTLTYVSGPNALAVVRPDLSTKYGEVKGEIITIPIRVVRSPELQPEIQMLYGYVGPSLENMVRVARDDQFDGMTSWEEAPCETPSTEPVQDWLWHFTWYMWLCETLHTQVIEEIPELPDRMRELTATLNRYYERRSYDRFDIEKFLADLLIEDPERVRDYMESRDGNEEDLDDSEED